MSTALPATCQLRRPLVIRLIQWKVDEPGKLCVLMGRGTWSASQFLLNDLESYTDAAFVGEPSASKGNAYGDARRWTAPHVTAELATSDNRANFDPALSAALSYTPRASPAGLLNEALMLGGGKRQAARRFERALASHPQNAAVADRLKQPKRK